jgi:conjugal transfer mating pair stabilization protein TraN
MSLKTLPALPVFLIAVLSLAAQAQSLSDAFNQGGALGRSGNAAARSQINGSTAQSNVPGYSANPPQASYFGSPGIAAPAAAAAANACTGTGSTGSAGDFAAQACNAVNFSQTNPTRRPLFSIGTGDPLLTGAKAITADPQSIAGNIAGTYSGCTVQTTTSPDRFETASCHQYRTIETLSCDKVLIVTPTQTPGCSDGQFLTRVTADPCPKCVDFVAFDFSCGANSYLMHVFTIVKKSGAVFMELGSQNVPGTLNTQIPKTLGPSQIDSNFCYQTYYSQSCSGANCSIGAWFANPCQKTSYQGTSTFAMPTTVSFIDTWDNQCAALETRAQ